MKIKEIMEEKKFVVSSWIISEVKKLALNLNEFLLILYFLNVDDKVFEMKKIIACLHLNEKETLEAFNSLIEKKIIVIESQKNNYGKMMELINLDYFYNNIKESVEQKKKEQTSIDIYQLFEKEFGRTISSMEYEIINAWLEKDFNEEMIVEALKEAVFNGVTNLRYIDKILYEWQKKGYKCRKDIENHFKKNHSESEPKKELFDYNWLDENE